jgi:predicted secreted hydrolase
VSTSRLTLELHARTLVIVAILCLCVLAQGLDWKPADPSYTPSLPRDHASHPENKIEWWYYTGNLDASDGRRFGYQLTFFRVGVVPKPANPSRWAVRDLYMAHFTISDISQAEFRFTERLNRAGIEWAGALSSGYRVWNEDWEAKLDDKGNHILTARERDYAIALTLVPLKAAVLHGEHGYSQKGAQEGNASHYYSLTRLQTRGRLMIGNEAIEVSGSSWMDHEFGTSFLEQGQIGWNWLSIQLDDSTELMFYAFRRRDAETDPRSGGTFVEKNGEYVKLQAGEVYLQPLRTWKSKMTGAVYPVEWKLGIPSRRTEITVKAALDDQELNMKDSTGVIYWEGAVDVAGTREGRNVRGHGYLEMTGYAGQTLDRVLN